MRAAAHIIGAACSILLLHCASPYIQSGNPGPVISEIDYNLGLLLYADLSLQNIGQYMESARVMALRLSYDKAVRPGGRCPEEYREILDNVLAAIGESRYMGIPVIDGASVDWPGAVKVRVSANGDSLSFTLPSVNPDTWGILSLRETCADIKNTDLPGKACDCAVPYGDHVKRIGAILHKIAAERLKVREMYGRLSVRRKVLETEPELK